MKNVGMNVNKWSGIAAVLCGLTFAGAAALGNENPKGENNRLRFKCQPGSESGSGHFIAGVIDWNGDEGAATIAVMKHQYGEGYYHGEGRTTLLTQMKMKVTLNDDGVNQVIRLVGHDKQSDLYITWKSDLPQVVPRRQYFVYKGHRFSMQECGPEVRNESRRR